MDIDLKARRRNAGLTQAEAAKLAGISQQALSAYENGSRHPDGIILTKLEQTFEAGKKATAAPENPTPLLDQDRPAEPEPKPPNPVGNLISQRGFIDIIDSDNRAHTLNIENIVDIFPPDRQEGFWKIQLVNGDLKISAQTADDIRQSLLYK